MDEFDLNDFIKVIHFDKIKVPTVPFHLPSNKTYNGVNQMREGELDFFKLAVTSKSTKSILMCSDMPMSDMAEDNEFNKKWMFAIACSIKKGLHLDMIHYLERPFEELLLGLEAWIPIYMTGQVSPYYIPNYSAHIFHHLNYISESAVLYGECIENNHDEGRYILTNNKEDIIYFKKKAKSLLKHAEPLMEIYDINSKTQFQEFLNSDAQLTDTRYVTLSSLPIYTISESLLDTILSANHITKEDIDLIKKHRIAEIERIGRRLKISNEIDTIYIPSEEEFMNHPMLLDVSGCFYENPIYYSYDNMITHLNDTKVFVENNLNYELLLSEISAFRNIKIEIIKNKYVIISKIKSPTIHFIIKHPHLVDALQNFSIPVKE